MKERVSKHFSNIEHSDQRDDTTLSQHIWNLKDSNTDYILKWNLVEEAPIFDHTTEKCRLSGIDGEAVSASRMSEDEFELKQPRMSESE